MHEPPQFNIEKIKHLEEAEHRESKSTVFRLNAPKVHNPEYLLDFDGRCKMWKGLAADLIYAKCSDPKG